MKFSTMLKGIRGEFDASVGGRGQFVCCTLQDRYPDDSEPLLRFIHKSLGCREGTDEGECTTVFDWMREHHWALYKEKFKYKSLMQQKYRLAWIDQMIAMFEAEGN